MGDATDASGNISVDPLFADAANGNLRLQAGSPCIDAGENDGVPTGASTDLAGSSRFADDPDTADTGSGTAPIVDMGAYEFVPVRELWPVTLGVTGATPTQLAFGMADGASEDEDVGLDEDVAMPPPGGAGCFFYRSEPAEMSFETDIIGTGETGEWFLVVQAGPDADVDVSWSVPLALPQGKRLVALPADVTGTPTGEAGIDMSQVAALPTVLKESTAYFVVRYENGRPSILAYRGVNVCGAEFGQGSLPGEYETHYIYPDVDTIRYFLAKGMTTLRLPFRWERLQRTLNAGLDNDELARLRATVQAITSAGGRVILDPHNFARYHGEVIGSGNVPEAAFADFWGRVAAEFAGNSNVVFGLMNEPHDIQASVWLSAANAAIQAIRDTGASNLVLVPGTNWTSSFSWNDDFGFGGNATTMTGIVDPQNNVAVEVHLYFDADNSGSTDGVVSHTIGRERLTDFVDWCRTNSVRGFLGELGAPGTDDGDAVLVDTLDYIETDANDVFLGWAYWAAGPWWPQDYHFSIQPADPTDLNQTRRQLRVMQNTLPAVHTVEFGPGKHGTRIGGGALWQVVPDGATAVLPKMEASSGWQFNGWNPSVPEDTTGDVATVAQYGAALDWVVTIDVAGASPAAVSFGMWSNGTMDEDADVDVPIATPAPDATAVYLYRTESQTSFSKDIIGTADVGEWFFVVQAGADAPVELSWSVAGVLPAGRHLTMYRVDANHIPLGGTARSMVASATRVVTADDAAFFVLRYADDLVADIALKEKWNLMSFPIQPHTSDVAALFDDANVVTSGNRDSPLRDGMRGTVYTGSVWEYHDRAYHEVTDVSPLVGYWVYADAPAALLVEGLPVGDDDLYLGPGWNLIGPAAPMVVPANDALRGRAWMWNAATQLYETTDDLLPCRGHWLNAREAATLESQQNRR